MTCRHTIVTVLFLQRGAVKKSAASFLVVVYNRETDVVIREIGWFTRFCKHSGDFPGKQETGKLRQTITCYLRRIKVRN